MANKNFVKKSKYNFKKSGEFETVFHLSLSSKAIFKLSEQALKLYILFVLHGKKNPPSIKMFSGRMGKSERTVSRVYEELKEKGFLKIECVKPKVYKYTFDFNGNVNYEAPKEERIEFTEKEDITENEFLEEEKELEVIVEDNDEEIFEKAKTIFEYEDFAVLENIFWELSPKSKNTVIEILEERLKREPQSKEVLKWIIEKVKYV